MSPSRRRCLACGNAHRRLVYNKYRDASRIRLLSDWRRLAPLIRPTYITCGKNERSIDRIGRRQWDAWIFQHRRFLSLSLSPRLLIRRRRFSRSRFYERIDKCSLSLSVCPRGLIAEAILSPISGSRVTLWFPVAAVLMTRAATSTSTWTMIAARSACNVCLFESATSTECCMRVCKFVYRKIH